MLKTFNKLLKLSYVNLTKEFTLEGRFILQNRGTPFIEIVELPLGEKPNVNYRGKVLLQYTQEYYYDTSKGTHLFARAITNQSNIIIYPNHETINSSSGGGGDNVDVSSLNKETTQVNIKNILDNLTSEVSSLKTVIDSLNSYNYKYTNLLALDITSVNSFDKLFLVYPDNKESSLENTNFNNSLYYTVTNLRTNITTTILPSVLSYGQNPLIQYIGYDYSYGDSYNIKAYKGDESTLMYSNILQLMHEDGFTYEVPTEYSTMMSISATGLLEINSSALYNPSAPIQFYINIHRPSLPSLGLYLILYEYGLQLFNADSRNLVYDININTPLYDDIQKIKSNSITKEIYLENISKNLSHSHKVLEETFSDIFLTNTHSFIFGYNPINKKAGKTTITITNNTESDLTFNLETYEDPTMSYITPLNGYDLDGTLYQQGSGVENIPLICNLTAISKNFTKFERSIFVKNNGIPLEISLTHSGVLQLGINDTTEKSPIGCTVQVKLELYK